MCILFVYVPVFSNIASRLLEQSLSTDSAYQSYLPACATAWNPVLNNQTKQTKTVNTRTHTHTHTHTPAHSSSLLLSVQGSVVWLSPVYSSCSDVSPVKPALVAAFLITSYLLSRSSYLGCTCSVWIDLLSFPPSVLKLHPMKARLSVGFAHWWDPRLLE